MLTHFSQYVLCFKLQHSDRSTSNITYDKTMLYLFLLYIVACIFLPFDVLYNSIDWDQFLMMYTRVIVSSLLINILHIINDYFVIRILDIFRTHERKSNFVRSCLEKFLSAYQQNLIIVLMHLSNTKVKYSPSYNLKVNDHS